jgi:hypothetical protein
VAVCATRFFGIYSRAVFRTASASISAISVFVIGGALSIAKLIDLRIGHEPTWWNSRGGNKFAGEFFRFGCFCIGSGFSAAGFDSPDRNLKATVSEHPTFAATRTYERPSDRSWIAWAFCSSLIDGCWGIATSS